MSSHFFLSHFGPSTEAAEGPYPWDTCTSRVATKRHHTGDAKVIRSRGDPYVEKKNNTIHLGPSVDKVSAWWAKIPANLTSTPGLREMMEEASAIGCIDFKLAPPHATAGVVLKSAINVVEAIFHRRYPMIFKFGYTHNCVFRWCNQKFGYATSRDRFDQMCILHICSEPFTPSMLEAALIEKYHSTLDIKSFDFPPCTFYYIMHQF